MRLFKRKIQHQDVYFVFNEGGLGDQIARLSPIRYCLENYPWVTPHLVVPEYFKNFAKYIFPDVNIMNFDEADLLVQTIGTPVHQIRSDIRDHTMIRTNLVDCAYNCLLDYQPKDISDKNYVQCPSADVRIFNVPEKFVVITTMFTAKVREFPSNVVQDIVNFCKVNGYGAVFLGKKAARAGNMHTIKGFSEVDYSQGLNLVDKTSLAEAATIMGKSSAVIGLDCGLLHLAATTNVPIVYGCTTVEPHHRLPVRHNKMGWNISVVEPDESLDCRYCQSRMNFVYDHSFTECFYGNYKCIKKMDSRPYIDALKTVFTSDDHTPHTNVHEKRLAAEKGII